MVRKRESNREARERESSVEDEKSNRIKNVKLMHGGCVCFTYGTLYLCVYFTLWPRRRGATEPWHAPLDCHCYTAKTYHLERCRRQMVQRRGVHT